MIDFRQWVRTFELSLEAHYGWTCADPVVQAIRHEKKPITHDRFADLVVKINRDEEQRDGVANRLQPSDWNFDDKTRLLYRHLIPKLNKRLYDVSNDIEDQTGLEVLRVVMDKADKIPENAEFIWNIAMTNMSRKKDGRLILCRNVNQGVEGVARED